MHKRHTDNAVDSLHEFGSSPPTVQRLWTDSAPEFKAAARRIRAQRPFAHYASTSHRPQANGRAERFNRLAMEGISSLLMNWDSLTVGGFWLSSGPRATMPLLSELMG